MLGFRLADFAFRAMMGAIFIGWFAYVFSLQADYEVAKKEAEAAAPKPKTTTFVEDSYDPMAVQPDPYAKVTDDVVREERFYDDVTAESSYEGY